MPETNIYLNMPLDLLSMIYFYLLTQQKTSQNWDFYQKQLQSIKCIAKERGMTLLELQTLGYWSVEQESNLVWNEYSNSPLNEDAE